jgi:hypothetical protein
MKHQIIFLIFILFIPFGSIAQAPEWEWVKRAGGISDDNANAIAVDDFGNSYLGGNFNNATITFDTITLTKSGSCDFFLVKHNTNGKALWAKNATGSGTEDIQSIAVDTAGNVYVTGGYSGFTITFDTITLTSGYSSHIFTAKYDSLGNILWVKDAGGYGDYQTRSIAIDNTGNVFVTGYFYNNTFHFGSVVLTTAGSRDMFIVKYDTYGNLLWAKSLGGLGPDQANSIAVDSAGYAYIAGEFRSIDLIINSDTIFNRDTTGTFFDILLVKFDHNGSIQWTKNAGGIHDDGASSIAFGPSGNLYMSGTFQSNYILFDSTLLSNGGTADVYFAKYDLEGNLLWVKSVVATSFSFNNPIAIDYAENIYLTGSYTYYYIIIGSSTLPNSHPGDYEDYIAKFDSTGNALWAKGIYGIHSDYPHAIAVNNVGSAYLAGIFASPTLVFDTDTLVEASGGANFDIYFAKLMSFVVNCLQVNVSCYGGNDGTATANAVGGGMAPFSYLWSTVPPQMTQTALGLTAGTYFVTVTDNNGVSVVDSIIITEPSQIISYNPQAICDGDFYIFNGHTYSQVGDYNDTLRASNECDSIVVTQISVYPLPYTPIITQNDSLLISNATNGNQWYIDNNIITGANEDSYNPTTTGYYFVIVTDSNGCVSDTSNIICVLLTDIKYSSDENCTIKIYPNPASDRIFIIFPSNSEIQIFNIAGQVIKTILGTEEKTIVDLKDLSKGLYVIKIKSDKENTIQKFVIE